MLSDDKFFSSLVSKKTPKSKSESSFRVLYYGEATVAVPFMWESQPGTPKHPSLDTSLPPLTPPPSYQFSPNKTKFIQKGPKPKFLFTLFTSKKNNHVPPTFSSSSISSSSSSSATMNLHIYRCCCFWGSRSTVGFGVDEDDHSQKDLYLNNVVAKLDKDVGPR